MRMSERLEQIKTNWKNYHMSIPDVKWLIEQTERVEELEKKLSINTNNMKQLQKQNVRYKQALEYIQRAIYTQHCTKNHKWNTEFEKGQISGLIQASNIVDKAIRKVEEETE
jgi:NAD(P)H-dependent flavin oxidoreductase YrpB (nitropropane dioxygenase family)